MDLLESPLSTSKRQTMPDLFPVPTCSRLVPDKVPLTCSQFPLSKRGTGTGGDLSAKA